MRVLPLLLVLLLLAPSVASIGPGPPSPISDVLNVLGTVEKIACAFVPDECALVSWVLGQVIPPLPA